MNSEQNPTLDDDNEARTLPEAERDEPIAPAVGEENRLTLGERAESFRSPRGEMPE